MSNSYVNRDEVSSALFWKYGERLLSQIINIVVQIFLARCLEPALFGELAILLVFVNVAGLFVQSGISTYIIQKEKVTDTDFSTVLFVSLVMAVIMYAVIFFSAPIIEGFYGYEKLCVSLRVIAITLVPNGFCAVYQGMLARKMAFRTIFIRSMIAIPISGIIGVVLARNGFGLWALVIQHLVNQWITAIILIVGARQKIVRSLAWGNIRNIVVFGGNILIQSLLLQLFESIRTLLIGKKYESEDLAYYDKGTTYTNYLYSGFSLTIAGVLLPTLTKVKDSKEEMKKIARRFLSLSLFIVTPLLIGFATTAKNWVPILLTEKWNPAIPFLVIFSIAKLSGPITTVNLQIYYSLGQVKKSRRLVSIECILSLIILLMTYRISTEAIAWGYVVIAIADLFIFAIPNRRNIDYSLKEQLFDFLPNAFGAGIMYLVIIMLTDLPVGRITTLILQIGVGIVSYLLIAMMIKNPSYIYAKDFLLSKVNKMKKA